MIFHEDKISKNILEFYLIHSLIMTIIDALDDQNNYGIN